MGKIEEGKLLYHLTKLSNLDSIIQNGLMSRKLLEENKTPFSDVADSAIMEKRKDFKLDEYIPFHFHPYSPFDVAVKNIHDEEFIYICITRSFARQNRFQILPKHPLSSHDINLLEYDEGVEKIDWEIMDSLQSSPEYDPNVKMAECLTESVIHVKDFLSIAVRNEDVKNVVFKKLGHLKEHVKINVQPWLNK